MNEKEMKLKVCGKSVRERHNKRLWESNKRLLPHSLGMMTISLVDP